MAVTHLNQQELSERWNISDGTLQRWRCKGTGPAFLKMNGRIVYRLIDIESYEKEELRKSTSEKLPSEVGSVAI